MTAHGAALLLLSALALPTEIGGVYSKTLNEYQKLAERIVNKFNEFFWLLPSMTRHINVKYSAEVGRLTASACGDGCTPIKGASYFAYKTDDFCPPTEAECMATAKQIADDLSKKTISTMPVGVFAKCSELKVSLGVTNQMANCI